METDELCQVPDAHACRHEILLAGTGNARHYRV
eukprot:CAMPEP_0169151634 /NCGR_PEP_ID=MMETSP1015-20121227/50970_1 /TAXON_ID=342587 /ORGANISM="Karlodinium micrum, Strain CCMP2283" /LENGTH=32 /DNA_ID= /DNA_START= /DNA_END= /DNA_ORIENTATION=